MVAGPTKDELRADIKRNSRGVQMVGDRQGNIVRPGDKVIYYPSKGVRDRHSSKGFIKGCTYDVIACFTCPEVGWNGIVTEDSDGRVGRDIFSQDMLKSNPVNHDQDSA